MISRIVDSTSVGASSRPSNVDVALCGALTMGSHQHVVRFPGEVNPHPKEYLMETRRHGIAPAMCASSRLLLQSTKPMTAGVNMRKLKEPHKPAWRSIRGVPATATATDYHY